MKKKLKKGKPITELVKGSIEYTMSLITQAFRAQFPSPYDGPYCYIADTFADHVIVSEQGSASTLKADEYYKVTYSKDGDNYTFAPRDEWEIVELAYQPQTTQELAQESKPTPFGKKGGALRLEEQQSMIELAETNDGSSRRIRANEVIVADVINGNKRRYPASVIASAVEEVKTHLNESNGYGRAIQYLGEAEHPSDKVTRRPNLLETVIKWDEISFDGRSVSLGGSILETSKGKDILALMEGGIKPGISLRGYGEAKSIKQNGDRFDEVTEVHFTGFDAVLEPSFEQAEAVLESIQGENEMNIEELLKLLKDQPELFQGVTEAQVKAMGDAQLKALEEKVRSMLGIDEKTDIAESLKATTEKARKFDEGQKQAEVTKAITEATKDLPFGTALNAMFVESMKEQEFATVDAVNKFAESQRKQFTKMAAAGVLKGMGWDESKKSIKIIGDVLETETGTPEFARSSFEIVESVRKHDNRAKRAVDERAETAAAVLTAKILERFDKVNQGKLMAESRMFQEAELTTDLNLPYSVSRAIIAEAFPNLVAAGIFDVDTIETSPTRIYYETFTGESGYAGTATDEVEAGGAEEVWYNLSHGRINPDSVVVTSNPAGTTYVEGTDYVINYADGKIKFLDAGSIGTNDVLVDYTYVAIRNGEMQPIERAKTTLAFKVIEAAADRLADQISSEAIVFSRSQLGWDAVARTMANLVRQIRRKIDQGLLYMAFSAVKSIPNNSTDPWTVGTGQDDLAELVRLMGNASVIVAGRFYEPTFYLGSLTRTDELSNWEGFKRDGFPNALLNAAGFAGSVKGKPIFASTEFPDSLIIAGNRELVQHRVYLPLTIKGPFPTYATSGDVTRLVAADQYYAEEYNATESLVPQKGAYVPIEEEGS